MQCKFLNSVLPWGQSRNDGYFCITRQMRSGVAGISMCLMPKSERASTTAFTTAGNAPTQPASPAPLVPSGLVLVGTGLAST